MCFQGSLLLRSEASREIRASNLTNPLGANKILNSLKFVSESLTFRNKAAASRKEKAARSSRSTFNSSQASNRHQRTRKTSLFPLLLEINKTPSTSTATKTRITMGVITSLLTSSPLQVRKCKTKIS